MSPPAAFSPCGGNVRFAELISVMFVLDAFKPGGDVRFNDKLINVSVNFLPHGVFKRFGGASTCSRRTDNILPLALFNRCGGPRAYTQRTTNTFLRGRFSHFGEVEAMLVCSVNTLPRAAFRRVGDARVLLQHTGST
jgi:hypothetical protein